jgi:uncharacterized protein YdaU (DUF1376 family)
VADAWLMRKLMCDTNKFNDLFKPLFSEFLTSDGYFYSQKRLSKEFAYVRMMRERNRGAAKSRWNKEKHPHSGNAPHPTPLTPSYYKKAKGNGHAKPRSGSEAVTSIIEKINAGTLLDT